MRMLPFHQVVDCVKQLYIECAHKLPGDVQAALAATAQTETNPRAKHILAQLVENARIAEQDLIPLCQDTGLPVAFIEIGSEIVITTSAENKNATVADAVQQGIALATVQGFLRSSVVAEPLNHRKNTGVNTPAVVHTTVVAGDKLKITLMAKGGGCENKSVFKMFNPTETKETIARWIVQVVMDAGADACPPFIVGTGLGGNLEQACLLAKKALLRAIGSKNPDPFYAQMEENLLAAVNATGLGPAGLGGQTTALAVFIETAACHIASLPVAVNIECHSHRHKSAVL